MDIKKPPIFDDRPSRSHELSHRTKEQLGQLAESDESRCVEFTELLNGELQKYRKTQATHKRGCRVSRDIYEKVGFNWHKTLQNTACAQSR